MELVFTALVALAILLFIVWRTTAARLQAVSNKLAVLEEKQVKLENILNSREGKAAKSETVEKDVADKVTAVPETTEEKDAGTPAIAAVEEPVKSDDASPSDTVPPEVVAVIMAAIAACGYSPAAIRSIRPQKRLRSRSWVMAGRLNGMR